MSCVDGRGGSKACALMQYRVRVEPRSCGGGQGHRSGLAVPPRRAAADADDPNDGAIRVENAAHLNYEILSVENSDACLLMTPKLFRLHKVGVEGSMDSGAGQRHRENNGWGIGVLLIVKFRPARAARDDSTLNMKR